MSGPRPSDRKGPGPGAMKLWKLCLACGCGCVLLGAALFALGVIRPWFGLANAGIVWAAGLVMLGLVRPAKRRDVDAW